MIDYEDYDTTSTNYDDTRRPLASEIILECFASHEKPLNRLEVLDAGCGTGLYAEAIIAHVAHVEAVDASAGMLEKAQGKLQDEQAQGHIAFHECCITQLPLQDNSRDAAMANQVVHHLGDSTETDFRKLSSFIGELKRVLRPGSRLVLNHCSQEQLRWAYWYYELIPQARDNFRRRYASLDVLRELLEENGFTQVETHAPLNEVAQGEAYFDGSGPLSTAWRDGDSVWALADAEELQAALERVRTLKAEGELDAFVTKHDSRRKEIGQITMVSAILA